MNKKVEFTAADLKKAFLEYGVFHSADAQPSLASIMLPKALLATLDLAAGMLSIDGVEADWPAEERIEFTGKDEALALRAIRQELAPEWEAAGFALAKERGFKDDTPGAEAVYCVTFTKPARALRRPRGNQVDRGGGSDQCPDVKRWRYCSAQRVGGRLAMTGAARAKDGLP